jgi:hypothetical protein
MMPGGFRNRNRASGGGFAALVRPDYSKRASRRRSRGCRNKMRTFLRDDRPPGRSAAGPTRTARRPRTTRPGKGRRRRRERPGPREPRPSPPPTKPIGEGPGARTSGPGPDRRPSPRPGLGHTGPASTSPSRTPGGGGRGPGLAGKRSLGLGPGGIPLVRVLSPNPDRSAARRGFGPGRRPWRERGRPPKRARNRDIRHGLSLGGEGGVRGPTSGPSVLRLTARSGSVPCRSAGGPGSRLLGLRRPRGRCHRCRGNLDNRYKHRVVTEDAAVAHARPHPGPPAAPLAVNVERCPGTRGARCPEISHSRAGGDFEPPAGGNIMPA